MGAPSGATNRVWYPGRSRHVEFARTRRPAREVLLVDEDTTTSSNMNSASDLASQRMNNKNAPTLFARCGFTLLEDEDEGRRSFKGDALEIQSVDD